MRTKIIALVIIFTTLVSNAATNKISRHFPVVVDGVSYDILLAYVEDAETALINSHSPMVVVRNDNENKNSKYPSIRFNRDDSFTLIANDSEELSVQGDLLLYYEDSIKKFIILSSGIKLVDSDSIELEFESALKTIKAIRAERSIGGSP